MATEESKPPEDDPIFQVADPEEYNQTQRLRAINRARERVEDTIEQSMVRQVTDPDFGEADRQQVIRASLYSYLTNIEWLMVDADERELLQDFELGVVTLDPPEEFRRWASERHTGYPRVIGEASLEPVTWTISGIHPYLTAPEVFEASWSLQIDERNKPPHSVVETRETYMPVHISMNAFRAANRFLKRAGIDVQMVEDRGDFGFDYSDILEEGPGGDAPPQVDRNRGEEE